MTEQSSGSGDTGVPEDQDAEPGSGCGRDGRRAATFVVHRQDGKEFTPVAS